MKLKKTAAILTALCMVICQAAPVSAAGQAADIITGKYYKLPADSPGTTGKKIINGRGYKFSSKGVPSAYTGTIKTNKGTKYFINGCPWYGWIKLSGEWYYFDPAKDGFMATSSVTTALGKYTFSSNGKWTGKYSSSAKKPSDFSLYLHIWGDKRDLIFDTKDKKLSEDRFTIDNSDKYTKRVVVNSKDGQVLYDMFMSCRMDKVKNLLKGDILAGITDEDEYYSSEGLDSFALSVIADGKCYAAKGDYSMYHYYSASTEVQSTAYYLAFINEYIKTLPAYASIEKAYKK